ncbi:plasmid replication/partition related protein [Dyella acidiphila]|uniref:Plasmid replication/partition related protein n=1 Tax=Dyella acidiphila TaxID=2775866 RepID=A0ABR9GDA8_9GAMM|nr:plasmid replication/partition related protein [Dyella acidiphila]MBE1162014.1 plasmid replication/partition related protein [Dyella acidiphila]
MDIVVNEELKAYIDPLTPEEYESLERSLLAEGCRDSLVLWGNVLVDGHNRYGLCRKHDLPFQTVQNPRFQSIEDVHLWMIEQHLGRRSVSDFQRGVLALRKREILAQRSAAQSPAPSAAQAERADEAAPADEAVAPAAAPAERPPSREALAREAKLSGNQVALIEKIQKQAAPEVVAAVRSGSISINAAAAVASLPEEEQREAALAGSKELKDVAKRVRESRRKPREAATQEASAPQAAADVHDDADELTRLRRQVAELQEENAALRKELADLQSARA